MIFFKILNDQDFKKNVVQILRDNSVSDELIQKYIFLISCGIEIFNYYCEYIEDYNMHISNIYNVYLNLIYDFIIGGI